MTKRDDPRCEHRAYTHRVSSIRDGDDDWKNKHMRSVWVCGRRDCTLDAQAWALRSGEPDVWTYATSGHVCEMCEQVVKSPPEAVVSLIERPAVATPSDAGGGDA